MFKVGDAYTLLYQGANKQHLTGEIVNSYEEEPGIWMVIVKEPQTGTLLKRRRTVKKTTPMTSHGGY